MPPQRTGGTTLTCPSTAGPTVPPTPAVAPDTPGCTFGAPIAGRGSASQSGTGTSGVLISPGPVPDDGAFMYCQFLVMSWGITRIERAVGHECAVSLLTATQPCCQLDVAPRATRSHRATCSSRAVCGAEGWQLAWSWKPGTAPPAVGSPKPQLTPMVQGVPNPALAGISQTCAHAIAQTERVKSAGLVCKCAYVGG